MTLFFSISKEFGERKCSIAPIPIKINKMNKIKNINK